MNSINHWKLKNLPKGNKIGYFFRNFVNIVALSMNFPTHLIKCMRINTERSQIQNVRKRKQILHWFICGWFYPQNINFGKSWDPVCNSSPINIFCTNCRSCAWAWFYCCITWNKVLNPMCVCVFFLLLRLLVARKLRQKIRFSWENDCVREQVNKRKCGVREKNKAIKKANGKQMK